MSKRIFFTVISIIVFFLIVFKTVSAQDTSCELSELIVVYEHQTGIRARSLSEPTIVGDTVKERFLTEIGMAAVIETEVSVEERAGQYGDLPSVKYVQPNFRYSLMETPNDPGVSQQWYLCSDARISEAWGLVRAKHKVKVAVIDTGVDKEHDDLVNIVDHEKSYDVVNETSELTDLNGHGTHVAGIIAAESGNGKDIAGVSYNTELICYNVFEKNNGKYSASTANIIKAYELAVSSGARVINMSLGGYISDTEKSDFLLEEAINRAAASNVITVCAGGNGLEGIAQTSRIYPADFGASISVINTDQNNRRASYADYNAYKDISAPGVNIYSIQRGGGCIYKSGTSMAAPIVSGAVALMLGVNPNLTTNQVKTILFGTAKDLGSVGWDWQYGHGLIDLEAAINFALNDKQIESLYIPIQDISLEQTEISIGSSATLQAIVSPKFTTEDKRIHWTSSNPETATVDASGCVIGHRDGKTVITATLTNGLKAECDVTIDLPLSFVDVKEDDWFYSPVKYMYQRGVMTGLNSLVFGVNENLARAQFAALLYKLEGSPAVAYESRFSDVADGQWYTKPILWAAQNGIVNGYQDGRFGVGDSINREQIATMLYSYSKFKGYDLSQSGDLSGFPDNSSVSAYAMKPLQWAVGVGFVSGTNGNLDPQGSAVRAQCATIMMRYLNVYE
ncbi:S8 family peptidase [Ohessyouella blattaphilus]|uniref:S8 family serine peptidase n=1 Tax=Ohessyouella blattaphilus TaxID=2949333 RepID=A0ABT1EDQ3_9FIRM|nr:S8 family serine peptidase [Ohessyouella blattaphilus]MCP1108636.1 S8 family serine peptidase [Ohessyouella blattaphilus]MCR8562030.1 S8 family serine peptidase [Ohessyouella blattaphilus]